MARHWTEKEVEYLREKWGAISLEVIAYNLVRSVEAVKVKAVRLGLGKAREAQGLITLNSLRKVLNCSNSMILGWEKRGLRLQRKKLSKEVINTLIDIEVFWKWAEKNKERVRWERIEPRALGKEPAWVKEARVKAGEQSRTVSNYFKEWTNDEDLRLIYYSERGIQDKEICKLLGRTLRSIRERRRILFYTKKKVNPVWNEEKEKKLIELHNKGLKYRDIAINLNQSEDSIKNKISRLRLGKSRGMKA